LPGLWFFTPLADQPEPQEGPSPEEEEEAPAPAPLPAHYENILNALADDEARLIRQRSEKPQPRQVIRKQDW